MARLDWPNYVLDQLSNYLSVSLNFHNIPTRDGAILQNGSIVSREVIYVVYMLFTVERSLREADSSFSLL